MSCAARFEVTDHFQFAERGAFVIGRILMGTIRPGMFALSPASSGHFTVRGVEFVDNLAEKKDWNALAFSEFPNLEAVREAFPVGTVIEVHEAVR